MSVNCIRKHCTDEEVIALAKVLIKDWKRLLGILSDLQFTCMADLQNVNVTFCNKYIGEHRLICQFNICTQTQAIPTLRNHHR